MQQWEQYHYYFTNGTFLNLHDPLLQFWGRVREWMKMDGSAIIYTHRIHVWYIYLHLGWCYWLMYVNVGTYTLLYPGMGYVKNTFCFSAQRVNVFSGAYWKSLFSAQPKRKSFTNIGNDSSSNKSSPAFLHVYYGDSGKPSFSTLMLGRRSTWPSIYDTYIYL